MNQWRLVFVVVVLTVIIVGLSVTSLLMVYFWSRTPTSDAPFSPSVFIDEVTDQPMHNRRVLRQDAFEIQPWSDGAVLSPSGDFTIVCDVISTDGVQPLTQLSLNAIDSFDRQWSAEPDLRVLQPVAYQMRDGRTLLRYRIENPFGRRFNADVCKPQGDKQGNEVRLDVTLHGAVAEENRVLGSMELRAVRR
jgi:hypothetical protein